MTDQTFIEQLAPRIAVAPSLAVKRQIIEQEISRVRAQINRQFARALRRARDSAKKAVKPTN